MIPSAKAQIVVNRFSYARIYDVPNLADSIDCASESGVIDFTVFQDVDSPLNSSKSTGTIKLKDISCNFSHSLRPHLFGAQVKLLL